MGDLTENFSRSEFRCKCGKCGYESADIELVTVLQDAVEHFHSKYGQRVSCVITSGNRCPAHNSKEGGSPNSKHMFSIAADHKFFLKDTNHQIEADEVAEYYEETYAGKYGIGRYTNRTHLDVRSGCARWAVST